MAASSEKAKYAPRSALLDVGLGVGGGGMPGGGGGDGEHDDEHRQVQNHAVDDDGHQSLPPRRQGLVEHGVDAHTRARCAVTRGRSVPRRWIARRPVPRRPVPRWGRVARGWVAGSGAVPRWRRVARRWIARRPVPRRPVPWWGARTPGRDSSVRRENRGRRDGSAAGIPVSPGGWPGTGQREVHRQETNAPWWVRRSEGECCQREARSSPTQGDLAGRRSLGHRRVIVWWIPLPVRCQPPTLALRGVAHAPSSLVPVVNSRVRRLARCVIVVRRSSVRTRHRRSHTGFSVPSDWCSAPVDVLGRRPIAHGHRRSRG